MDRSVSLPFRLIAFGLIAAALAAVFVVWAVPGRSVTALAAGGAGLVLFCWMCWRSVPGWLGCFGKREDALTLQPEPAVTAAEWKQVVLLTFCSVAVHLALSTVLRMVAERDFDLLHALREYHDTDTLHYMNIATRGYVFQPDSALSRRVYSDALDLVFFPGYPTLVSLFMLLIPNAMVCGYLAAFLPWMGAGCVMYRLFRLDMSHDRAMLVILLFCLMPVAVFFSVPMSESLFLLCTVSAIYFARRDRWFCAGLCGMMSALTRSAGVFVLIPLAVELVDRFGWQGLRPLRDRDVRRELIRRGAWMLLVPVGLAWYLCINRMVTGSATKFMDYQNYWWGQGLSSFFNCLGTQADKFLFYLPKYPLYSIVLHGGNLIFGLAAVALIALSAPRLRPSYTLWFAVYFAFSYGAANLLSGPRYLTVFFPLAIAVDEVSTNKEAAVIAMACTAISYTMFFASRCGVY